MGKSQTKKRTVRHNPIRLPDHHNLNNKPKTEGQVIPVLEKFKSPHSTERVWACAAVTNLISNDPSTRRLLQSKGVIALLIERLSDNEPDVINESTGSLRNLCIDGGPDICAEMYNKNIIAPLRTHITKIISLIERIVEGLPPNDHDEINWRRIVWTWIENIVTIFWCLSETSNKAFKAVNELNLPSFLITFIKNDLRKICPLKTLIASCQCLYIVSEDNNLIRTHFYNNPGDCSSLVEIINEPINESDRVKSYLIKILACGIIRNISPLPAVIPAAAISNDINVLLPILLSCVDTNLNDISNESKELASNLPHVTGKKNNNPTDHKSNEEKRLDEIESVLTTLQTSLDVLTSLCSQLPEDDLESIEINGNEEENMDDEMEEDIDTIIAAGNGDKNEDSEMKEDLIVPTTSIIPNSLLSLFSSDKNLHIKLIKLSYPTELSFPPLDPNSSSVHLPTTAHLSAVHVRALEALQNLLLSLARYAPSPSSPTSEEDNEAWKSLKLQLKDSLIESWQALFEIGNAIEPGNVNNFTLKTQTSRFSCIENLIGCMLGISKVLSEDLPVQPNQVHALMSIYNSTSSDAMKSKIVGTLGSIARKQDAIEDNKLIGNFLIHLLTLLPKAASKASENSTSPEVTIAILNELFDIYADENSTYDKAVFEKEQFLSKLKTVAPLVRSCTRSVDRKSNPELRMSIDEAYQNLLSFLRYRQSLA